MEFTQYFLSMRQRADRAVIDLAWIRHTMEHPEKEVIQMGGRIRRWAKIPEANGKYLRVILLPDGKTIHPGSSIRAKHRCRSGALAAICGRIRAGAALLHARASQ